MEKKVKVPALTKQQTVRLVKDNNSVLILLVLLFIAFFFIDGFSRGFYNVILYSAQYLPIALGLGLVMITGNIDLSVGFQAALCAMTSVMGFNVAYAASGNAVVATLVALVCAVVTGAVSSFVNGFIITKIGVSPLIATIATNYIFRGLVFNWAKSSITLDDKTLMQSFAKTLKIGGLKWLTPMIFVIIIVLALVFFWMYKARFGNRLHVVGDNPEAAAYAGISVSNTVLVTYVVCGILVALTGFLMVCYDGNAIYTQGTALGTFPIACCVVGGIKMQGGKGTAIHIMLGVLIMRTISQMMVSLFLSPDMVNLITGILLIAVLIMDRFTSTKGAND